MRSCLVCMVVVKSWINSILGQFRSLYYSILFSQISHFLFFGDYIYDPIGQTWLQHWPSTFGNITRIGLSLFFFFFFLLFKSTTCSCIWFGSSYFMYILVGIVGDLHFSRNGRPGDTHPSPFKILIIGSYASWHVSHPLFEYMGYA